MELVSGGHKPLKGLDDVAMSHLCSVTPIRSLLPQARAGGRSLVGLSVVPLGNNCNTRFAYFFLLLLFWVHLDECAVGYGWRSENTFVWSLPSSTFTRVQELEWKSLVCRANRCTRGPSPTPLLTSFSPCWSEGCIVAKQLSSRKFTRPIHASASTPVE